MDQYINAFRQAVRNANRIDGTQIQPRAAALLMLRGIQNKLPMWVTTIKYNISKRAEPGKMTEMELLELCEKAIDQGREREPHPERMGYRDTAEQCAVPLALVPPAWL